MGRRNSIPTRTPLGRSARSTRSSRSSIRPLLRCIADHRHRIQRRRAFRDGRAFWHKAVLGGSTFRNGVYWCVRPNQPVHERVQALAERLGSNFTILGDRRIRRDPSSKSPSGLVGKDRFSNAQVQLWSTRLARAFDERSRSLAASLDDLDLGLGTIDANTDTARNSDAHPSSRDALSAFDARAGTPPANRDRELMK